jgi:hypothetical protein
MRRLELPKLMRLEPCWRQGINASAILASAWRLAFPAPKRRRLNFNKDNA